MTKTTIDATAGPWTKARRKALKQFKAGLRVDNSPARWAVCYMGNGRDTATAPGNIVSVHDTECAAYGALGDASELLYTVVKV